MASPPSSLTELEELWTNTRLGTESNLESSQKSIQISIRESEKKARKDVDRRLSIESKYSTQIGIEQNRDVLLSEFPEFTTDFCQHERQNRDKYQGNDIFMHDAANHDNVTIDDNTEEHTVTDTTCLDQTKETGIYDIWSKVSESEPSESIFTGAVNQDKVTTGGDDNTSTFLLSLMCSGTAVSLVRRDNTIVLDSPEDLNSDQILEPLQERLRHRIHQLTNNDDQESCKDNKMDDETLVEGVGCNDDQSLNDALCLMRKAQLHEALYDPTHVDWNNDEFVTGWITMMTQTPQRMYKYFAEPDEVNRFLIRLWMRGSPMYCSLMRSEQTHNYSIHMFLLLLHGSVRNALKNFVNHYQFLQLQTHSSPSIADKGKGECLSSNSIITKVTGRPRNKYGVLESEVRRQYSGQFTKKKTVRGTSLGPPLDDRFHCYKTSFEDFEKTNFLYTQDLPHDEVAYSIHMQLMGMVGVCQRKVYEMDLTDLTLVLRSVGTAWVSQSFWFGTTMTSSLEEQDEDRQSRQKHKDVYSPTLKCFATHTPTIPLPKTLNDTMRCTSKKVVTHIRHVFGCIELLMHWIYIRAMKIFSHESMYCKDNKVKELLMTITETVGLYTSLCGIFNACYSDEDWFCDLKSLASLLYGVTKRNPKKKKKKGNASFAEATCSHEIGEKIENESEITEHQVYSKLLSGDELAKRLSNHAQYLASESRLAPTILRNVKDFITPICTDAFYFGRNCGERGNLKNAVEDVMPWSVNINLKEALVMRDGAVDCLEHNIPQEYYWAVSDTLQIQAVTSIAKQTFSDFSWDEAVILRETEMCESARRLDPWPDVANQKPRIVVQETIERGTLKRHIFTNPSKRDTLGKTGCDSDGTPATWKLPHKRIVFSDEKKMERRTSILKFGCLYIVHCLGVTFMSPRFAEVFEAWCLCKDTIAKWDTVYYCGKIAQDKSIVTELKVANIKNPMSTALFARFKSESERTVSEWDTRESIGNEIDRKK